jgi:hypothetical protein
VRVVTGSNPVAPTILFFKIADKTRCPVPEIHSKSHLPFLVMPVKTGIQSPH